MPKSKREVEKFCCLGNFSLRESWYKMEKKKSLSGPPCPAGIERIRKGAGSMSAPRNRIREGRGTGIRRSASTHKGWTGYRMALGKKNAVGAGGGGVRTWDSLATPIWGADQFVDSGGGGVSGKLTKSREKNGDVH